MEEKLNEFKAEGIAEGEKKKAIETANKWSEPQKLDNQLEGFFL